MERFSPTGAPVAFALLCIFNFLAWRERGIKATRSIPSEHHWWAFSVRRCRARLLDLFVSRTADLHPRSAPPLLLLPLPLASLLTLTVFATAPPLRVPVISYSPYICFPLVSGGKNTKQRARRSPILARPLQSSTKTFDEVFDKTLDPFLGDQEGSDQIPDQATEQTSEYPFDQVEFIYENQHPAQSANLRQNWAVRSTLSMAEPRARAARQKGQMNFPNEIRAFLIGHGDRDAHPYCPQGPLPETVRVLDEIVTDYILEMCHEAASAANYARRQKVKVEDFRFALRRDAHKLGRVQQLLQMDRELKDARKAFDQDDDQVATGKKVAEELDVSVDGTVDTAKKSKGKGKRTARRDSDVTEDAAPKKYKIDP